MRITLANVNNRHGSFLYNVTIKINVDLFGGGSGGDGGLFTLLLFMFLLNTY